MFPLVLCLLLKLRTYGAIYKIIITINIVIYAAGGQIISSSLGLLGSHLQYSLGLFSITYLIVLQLLSFFINIFGSALFLKSYFRYFSCLIPCNSQPAVP